MNVHTIRLGNAWEPSASGAAWTRRFGRPAGLGPGDRVLLRVASRVSAAVSLNDAALNTIDVDETGDPWRQEITALLRDRNTLVLKPAATPAIVPPAADAAVRGRVPLPEEIVEVSLEIVPASG